MSYSKITIKNIDNNLFSGSRDTLRTQLGIYYNVVTDTDGHSSIIKNSLEPSSWAGDHGPFNDITAKEANESDYISYLQTNNTLTTTASANVVVKTKKMFCRLIGDQTKIESDLQWKTLLLGGNYADQEYSNIFETATFDDHSYNYDRPYNIVKAKQLAANIDSIGSYDSFENYEIGYSYNYHLPQYENTLAGVNNLMMPNIYMLQMVADSTDVEKEYSKNIINFVTVENQFSASSLPSLFLDESTEEPPPHYNAETDIYSTPGVTRYYDQSYNFRDYLANKYANTDYSSTTTNSIIENSNTLYYNTDFAESVFASVNDNIHRMPVSAFVRFPTDGAFEGAESTSTTPGTTYYTDIIKDNSLEEDMLYFLKNNFGASNQQLSFVQQTQTLEGENKETEDTTYIYQTKISDNKKNSVNLLSALGSIYDSARFPKQDGGTIMGPRTLDTITTENADSKFRFFKRIKSAQAIEDTINKMNDIITTTDGLTDIRDILNSLEDNKGPAETIAYRLQKVGGSFLDSDRRVTTLQNSFFINNDSLRSDGTNLVYHDTQVKLNEEYSYTLYAYVIIPGYQYRYDNLRISRQIGTVSVRDSTGSFAPTSEPEDICIEFYDPTTDNAASQLLNTETNLLGTEYIVVNSEQNLDVFRYAFLFKDEDLMIQDMFPNYDVATHIDSFGDTVSPTGYGDIFGSDLSSEASSFLTTYSPAPDTRLVDFFHDNRTLWNPTDSPFGTAVGFEVEATRTSWAGLLTETGHSIMELFYKTWALKTKTYTYDGHGAEYEAILAEPAANRFATNAQIKSENKYLADYNFTIAPSVKIIEIPVATKTIRVMDHPPVAPDVTPYQRKDDSQIIGFYVRTESFRVPTDPTDTTTMSSFGIYPTALNNDELTKAEVYKTSNNMIEGEQIAKNSVSKPSRLEVYRIDQMPKSISDFNGNLVFTKDLSIEGMTNQKHTSCFYEEMIRTNKKYYYLFRFLNENGDSGYLAPIQVAELVNDGGYKYTKFDVIYESDLELRDDKQDTTTFKKLMQITPAIEHLKLNDANVDYSQPAATQMTHLEGMVGTAEDLIWGKTFKFRITSKKTGKKIDLNIKYKLRDS
jgi:hypothetical protein